MSEQRQWTDLQMAADPARERLEWRIQRIGWLAMIVVCGAALAGFLGRGPVSKKQVGKIGSNLYVEFEQYVRNRAPFTLKVYCRGDASQERFTLSLDRNFIKEVEVKAIQPEPVEVTGGGAELIYHFKSRGEGEQMVIFRLEPDKIGKLETAVTLNGTESYKLKQIVWP